MAGARGEGIIQANGREVHVLFNNRALAGAEKELGKGIIDLFSSFQTGGSVNDIAVLLRHGMDAARRDLRLGGRPVSMLDVYSIMDDVGFTEVATVVIEGVSVVLGYSDEDDEQTEPGLDEDPNE